MVTVTNNRQLLHEEEVKRNAGVSEALAKKLAGITNFLSTDMLMRDDFKANGGYWAGVDFPGLDGILVFPTKCEIALIAFSNAVAGVAGDTIFDVHWMSAPNVDEGSIFSTLPSIDFSAGDNAYTLTDVVDNVNIVTVTGGVNPILNKTVFEQGEAIRVDIDSAMEGGENAQLSVFYRPVT